MCHCFGSMNAKRCLYIKRLLLFLSAVLVFLCFSQVTWAEEVGKRKERLTITADRLETFQGGREIVFSGDVLARQGDMTVESDVLRIYYLSDSGSDSGSEDAAMDRGIEKVEAEGSVVIRGETSMVTGDHALLNYEDKVIVITGEKAVLTEGDNIIEGDRITWHIDEEQGIVEDRKRGRVKAVIAPAEDKNK